MPKRKTKGRKKVRDIAISVAKSYLDKDGKLTVAQAVRATGATKTKYVGDVIRLCKFGYARDLASRYITVRNIWDMRKELKSRSDKPIFVRAVFAICRLRNTIDPIARAEGELGYAHNSKGHRTLRDAVKAVYLGLAEDIISEAMGPEEAKNMVKGRARVGESLDGIRTRDRAPADDDARVHQTHDLFEMVDSRDEGVNQEDDEVAMYERQINQVVDRARVCEELGKDEMMLTLHDREIYLRNQLTQLKAMESHDV